jgi:uncharacterized protein
LRLFLKYLKNPHYIKSQRVEWSLFFKLLAFYYFILVPLGLIVGLLIKVLKFHETDFDYSSLKILFAGIVIGPIIEEILFRFLLIPRYINFVIYTCFSFCLAIISLLKGSNIYLLIFLIFGIASFLFCLNIKYLRKAQKFLLNHYCFYFYLSCILFGFYHITNYIPVNYKLFLIMPVIVFPQMVIGAFLGYLRMKFGILYSILFHSITNIFPILILIFNVGTAN